MIGRRLAERQDGSLEDIQPGDYWKDSRNGKFYAACPVRHQDETLVVAGLGRHDVTEHEDGTITVWPSILVAGGPNMTQELYHGFLERGVWMG